MAMNCYMYMSYIECKYRENSYNCFVYCRHNQRFAYNYMILFIQGHISDAVYRPVFATDANFIVLEISVPVEKSGCLKLHCACS